MNAQPTQDTQPARLRIWQQNLNNSTVALFSLINSPLADNWDIIALQEPPIDALGNTKANSHWRAVYPTHKLAKGEKPRAVMFVNARLSTNTWEQVQFPSADVAVTRFRTAGGTCTVFNIYNDCTHDRTVETLERYLAANIATVRPTGEDHMVWLGDFNRHHPLWDEERNSHLFTTAALAASQKLLDMIADYGMTQLLPKDVPTLQSSSSGNWTRPDNVFGTEVTAGRVVSCVTSPENRGPNTDHLPVLTQIDLAITSSESSPTRNYREVDWTKFNRKLRMELEAMGPPRILASEAEFQSSARKIELALQRTVEAEVPKTRPHPHRKRWWNKDLTKMRNDLKTLSKASHVFRALPNHPSHRLRKEKAREYDKAISKAKKEHWLEWLEEMDGNGLWTANNYISNPTGDGSKTRIPTLQKKESNGTVTTADTNEDKSIMLAQSMFPPPPPQTSVPEDHVYPEQATKWFRITEDQLQQAITKLSPYKAPGPDGVANIVFQRCPLLSKYLLPLFNAVFTFQTYYEPWKESITAILRKPGKPDYAMPKAYRPIALLNTTAKLLSSIVADRTSFILEAYNLLPPTHFGGRPGRSTEDSLLLLENTIRHAWRQHKVVSALFLDIEGAFPNAVTDRLIHNMKMRRLPKEIVDFTSRLLRGRKTKMRFDDFESDWMDIRNGIGQGDPLSMILYVIYSSDLVDIAKGKNELTLAFVDDTALIAIGKTFTDTHSTLADMMERGDGAYEWSHKHNSRFETSKFALMDFTRSRTKERPTMTLRGANINPSPAHRFLGIILDQELRWKQHAAFAIAKGTKHAIMMRRLSSTTRGVPLKLMRQIYISAVVPKITYGASVWIQPPYSPNHERKTKGSLGIAKKITTIQRTAIIAASGAMCTSPTDSLFAHAYVPPVPILLQKTLYNSALRLSSLPEKHPLHPLIRKAAKRNVKRHRSALHKLTHDIGVAPDTVETISPCPIPPSALPAYRTSIAADKEEAVAEQQELTDRTQIFTDGSSNNGKVGAAAVLYVDARHVATLRYHLGKESEHTVFEAEASALILAAHLLATHDEVTYPASILADNQAAIRSCERPSSKPGHHLLLSFRSKMRKIAKENGLSRNKITVRWIAGHRNVKGNEMADKEAKTAAEGKDKSSPVRNLPLKLRSPLPHSIPALKQQHNAKLEKVWKAEWRLSPRYHRTCTIDPKLPSRSFLKLAGSLCKKQTGLYIQMRTNHIPLNQHLHRIKRSDTPLCLQCGEVTPENVHHFLFQCPRYERERHRLFLTLGRQATSISYLLTNTNAQVHLLKYVNATKRMTGTFGEVPTTPPNVDDRQHRLNIRNNGRTRH